MMETCLLPEIWKSVPAAVVQGCTTQEPPPVGYPISMTRSELRKAAGTRLPQEKELLLVRQYSL